MNRINPEGAYGAMLKGRLSLEERGALLKKLRQRATLIRPRNMARGTSISAAEWEHNHA